MRMISARFRPIGLRRTAVRRRVMNAAARAIVARLPPDLRRHIGSFARAPRGRIGFRRTSLGPNARRFMQSRRPGRPIPRSGGR